MMQRSKNTERILTGLVILAFAGMFLPMTISNVLIGLLLLFSLLLVRSAEWKQTWKSDRLVQIQIAAYGLLLAGLLYTSNMEVGLFMLEKKLSLLLIPLLLMPCLKGMNVPVRSLLIPLGFVAIASSVVMLVIAAVRWFWLNDEAAFYFENLTPIHYVYYAIYFGCGSIILIGELFDQLARLKYGIITLIALYGYSLAILILVASKTGIIMFGAATAVLLYKKIQDRKILAFALVALVTCASILLYFNDTTLGRFRDLTENLTILSKEEVKHGELFTDLNMRLLFWKISVSHAIQDHLWMFGTGTGDCQDYINSLYNLPQYELFGYINWDSHNQWVFTFVQLGLVGLSLLAVLYGYYLVRAFQKNDTAMLSFLVITGGFSLSESILESNKGIIFFSLFFTVLASQYKDRGEHAGKA